MRLSICFKENRGVVREDQGAAQWDVIGTEGERVLKGGLKGYQTAGSWGA
jgi:hypothetical protein